MTVKEIKTEVNSITDLSKLKVWFTKNGKNLSPSATAYVKYRMHVVSPADDKPTIKEADPIDELLENFMVPITA